MNKRNSWICFSKQDQQKPSQTNKKKHNNSIKPEMEKEALNG